MIKENLVIDGYLFLEVLASGSHATVWKAEKLGKLFAVKVARGDGDGKNSERLGREADILGQLNHENILHIFDTLTIDGELGLVFLLFESSLSTRNPSSWLLEKKIHFAKQLIAGIAYLHEHGIIHGDIKLANLLLIEDLLILCDLGISWLLSEGLPEKLFGSPQYAAPEMFIADAELNEKVDIYAVGIVLYWLLSGGRFPFDGNYYELAYQHVHCNPPVLDTAPYEIQRVLAQALHKDSMKRPSAADLWAMLEDAYNQHLLAETLHMPAVLIGPVFRRHPTSRRIHLSLAVIGVLLFIFVPLILIVLLFR